MRETVQVYARFVRQRFSAFEVAIESGQLSLYSGNEWFGWKFQASLRQRIAGFGGSACPRQRHGEVQMRQNLVRIVPQDPLMVVDRFLELTALERHQSQVHVRGAYRNLLGIPDGRIEESQMPQHSGALMPGNGAELRSL